MYKYSEGWAMFIVERRVPCPLFQSKVQNKINDHGCYLSHELISEGNLQYWEGGGGGVIGYICPNGYLNISMQYPLCIP